MAQVLRYAGWSTFWLGKNHNVPEQDVAPGASRKSWPLAMGFDRYYGFIGGETNNWYPDLVEDNKFIEQPYGPEDGYHLSKDLADKAIGMIRDQKASNPSKPWYMWFCPGANRGGLGPRPAEPVHSLRILWPPRGRLDRRVGRPLPLSRSTTWRRSARISWSSGVTTSDGRT